MTGGEKWTGDVVATRTSTGQVFLLLDVSKTVCANCRYGVFFETLWGSQGDWGAARIKERENGSPAPEGLRITWCRSCFNAECEPAELDDRQRSSLHLLRRREARESGVRCWNGARPAIEDLESRGLV